MEIRKFLLKINDINQKQWLICSIFTTTIGVWYSLILNFFGTYLYLVRIDEYGNKSFTWLGLTLTILTVGWSLLSLASQRYSEHHNRNLGATSEALSNTDTLYETINESVCSIIENGIDEKLEYIEALTQNKINDSRPIKKPCVTIKKITAEITHILSKLLTTKKVNIREKDLHVNVFYRFPNDEHSQWHIADSVSQENGLTLKELEAPDTTMSEAINSKTNYVCYNDKNVAFELNHYVPDNEEVRRDGKIVGSIACFFFKIRRHDITYVEFVLTLATYGKRFTDSKDARAAENIAYNLKNNIFSEYETLLKSALLDLYITHLLEHHC